MAQQLIELILARQLATTLAVPVVLFDGHGDPVFINEAGEALLGIRIEDFDRQPLDAWLTVFRPRSLDGRPLPAEALPFVIAMMERRPAQGPILVAAGDGERAIEVSAFPLEGGRGRFLGVVAMFWEH